MTFIWKANPPRCKDCCGREKEASSKGLWMSNDDAAAVQGFLNDADKELLRNPPPFRTAALKAKPKPRVNGKPLHTALYMSAFGYGDTDFVPSEMSGQRCQDVHHISSRGSGGTKTEDRIENLMGLTREEHMEYGDKTQHMAMLYALHMDFMEKSGVKFDREWILGQIEKYSEI
jgi:hypothetical protein